ncbi:MAG: hypothetical protein M1825_000712 [Sarcosagium campestre]|nr:MAG: hypothetical protein M1825_000712 [Sarcosagium campestre]
MYRQKFRDAEQAIESRERSLQKSIANVLDGAASRIYAILEKLGVFEGMEEEIVYEMSPEEAGFFSPARKSIRNLAAAAESLPVKRQEESAIYEAALKGVDERLRKDLGLLDTSPFPVEDALRGFKTPVCDRCHKLIHHQVGVPIYHPSVESIHDTIAESPHKSNHIYHVIDAADFPMSLIPNLQRQLSLAAQRSWNRRSRTEKFYRGSQMSELSFIITRSDLLAPQKEMVDRMMPYLIQVLREALGPAGKGVRLGNVRCVSAKRGWWTKELKEDIWRRGGAVWMVGKVNVGKSNLFETVFPKGREGDISFSRLRRDAGWQETAILPTTTNSDRFSRDDLKMEEKDSQTISDEITPIPAAFNVNSLLPPPQPSSQFPTMPIVSSLPGTTASPIRVPFGKGRGELIDLPGFARGGLENYIQSHQRQTLVMRSRVKPEQIVIKPGQSLLLGDLIRITPEVDQGTVILAYPFTPLKAHITATEKAIEIQNQTRGLGELSIANEKCREHIRSAGTFDLRCDVTKHRAGPLTSPAAAGLKTDRLPFMVLATDILVEGCGWVELVAQVRRKDFAARHVMDGGAMDADVLLDQKSGHFPAVEIFSPEGKFIAQRQCMNAWVLGGNDKTKVSAAKERPRRSMKGARRNRVV